MQRWSMSRSSKPKSVINTMSTDLIENQSLSAGPTLIDTLLREQQLFTPVANFSRKHERHDIPAQAKYYRDLIPISFPRPGEQYAFAVDLDACTGCKACVTACHNLNGLDEGETWRDVGILFGGTTADPVQQTVTTACHHCIEPACMIGCPVNAYEKDPVTGIVHHLDDQCIGCQYCILKCPYDVPKYSKKRGIVRKCDMCSSRLVAGEAPACVQACPNEAIQITVVVKEQIALERENKTGFLPGTPDPDYTLPTTIYRSARNLPDNMRPGDFYKLKPGYSHLPLVLMLVLTQLSVGAYCTAIALRLLFPLEPMRGLTPFHSLVALLLGGIAIGASTLHLGRPLYAWRAFIGLKTSWLSREIVAFGLFAGFALIYAASFWLPVSTRSTSLSLLDELHPGLQNAFGAGVAISGLAGVFCSIMIYRDTRRTFWQTSTTPLKFLGTILLLGPATILCATTLQSMLMPATSSFGTLPRITELLCEFIVGATIAKLGLELGVFVHLTDCDWTNMKRTAVLMSRELRHATIARFLCGVLGGVMLPVLMLLSVVKPLTAVGTVALLLLGELLERYLFFSAVVPPKMPGGIAS
jgi:formate dehydrogenase iron-sulfur subunit